MCPALQAKQGKFVWARRWTIIGLCFLAFALCNMDRVNMSIAILPMSEAFGWDSTTVGLVQSSFFWCVSSPRCLLGKLEREGVSRNS